jgi:hypothetical protein
MPPTGVHGPAGIALAMDTAQARVAVAALNAGALIADQLAAAAGPAATERRAAVAAGTIVAA